MTILHIVVQNKIATYNLRDGDIVCGNDDYKIEFAFDSEWDAYDKKIARLIWNGKHTEIPFTGNTCEVPILKNTDKLTIGVHAGDLRTTTPAEIACKRSILCMDSEAIEADEHYTSVAEEAADTAVEAAERAAEEATKAKAHKKEASESADRARQYYEDTVAFAGEFEGNLKNIEAGINRNDKRITNLEQGILPDPFETDDSVAYAKAVPVNALPFAEVSMVGGMTHKDATSGMLRDAKVTAVKSMGTNVLPFPYNGMYNVGYTTMIGGITYTINTDRSITASGTPTGSAIFILASALPVTNQIYSMSLVGSANNLRLYVQLKDSNGTIVHRVSTQGSVKFDAGAYAGVTSATVYLNHDTETAAIDGTVQLMINVGNVVLPYEPYVEDTFVIPDAVQNLEGYGWGISDSVYNHIDWGKKQFIKRVDRVDLGTLSWKYYNTSEAKMFYAKCEGAKNARRSVCSKYESVQNVSGFLAADKSCYIGYIASPNSINVVDSTYDNATDFKTAVSGVMFYYELATPIVTDISDFISVDNMIGVEGNGSITCVNEHRLAVPSEVTYQLKGVTA